MWSDIRLYYTNRAVEITLAFITSCFAFGAAAFGDWLFYIFSRYILRADDLMLGALSFWKFAFFIVVFAWSYRAYRN